MRKIITAILSIISMLPGAVNAATVDISITTDTYVSASATSSNYGTGWYLYAQNSPSLLTLVKVDLTSIPANATILKAELYLYTSAVTSSSSVFYFDKVTQSWGETTATYANKPTTTTTGRITKSGLPSTPTIDITTWAQGWYTPPTTNYGFQISAAASGNSATFYSAEFGGTVSLRPYVRVTYIAPTNSIAWTNKTGGFYGSGTSFGTMYSTGTGNSYNTLPANTDGVFSFTISTINSGSITLGLTDPDNLSTIRYGFSITYNSSTSTSTVIATANGSPVGYYYNIAAGTACSIKRIGNNMIFSVGASTVTYTGTSTDASRRLVAVANILSTGATFISSGVSFGSYYSTPATIASYAPSRTTSANYIATISPRIAVSSIPTSSRAPASYPEDIRYFDGLGRPVLTVSVCASPTGKDIVTEVGYDNVGRQVYDYLPFTKASNNGAFIAAST
ncbi:MAG TPA: hypothetical protein DD653_01755, partial [Marinilabiliales bacterium]|nr:hypothetical protein [Marinilabiliales bacterium]